MAERLSDHEIRDITKALEAGIPIDDKYRYLIFKEARQVELVWNGKNTDVQDVVLPFQVIEHIDEPRDEVKLEQQQSLFDTSGKKVQGWSNKLIWGDNKYVLSSLKSGPIRDEIEANGGIKLIYIDPPFDVGADFSTTIQIGETDFDKAPTVLEEIAFRDTWGQGQDSFLAMIYERLSLLRDLLAPDGTIFLHCDWKTSANIRLIMDELFQKENFINEITWHYYNKMAGVSKCFPRASDRIISYAKNYGNHIFHKQVEKRDAPIKQQVRQHKDGKAINARDKDGKPMYRTTDERRLDDVWRIPLLPPADKVENLRYPTQKPEELVRRLIESASNEGDIVLDCFVGSGTTAAIAEKLNRKWIVSDIGRFAVNTSRKRLIKIQRESKKTGKDFRSFEVLSIGSYSYNDSSQQREFNETVLRAYKAELIENSIFAGKKGNHYVVVGPLDLPVSRDFVDEIIEKCLEQKVIELDILAFEFGMGVVPDAADEANKKGVKLNLKIIPREVFDKRAVAVDAVRFTDVGYLDVKIQFNKLEAQVELTDFSIFASQDSLEMDGENLPKGKSKIILDNGIIKKITKNKDGIIKILDIATNWVDWIDYWSIDFNFEDRQELKLVKHDDGRIEQLATGRNIFDNQWQSFKTNSEKIELTSSKYQYPKAGKYKIAVKVIDVFGNDTTRVFDINVGK